MLKKDQWVKRISYGLANSLALYKKENHAQKYLYYYSLQIIIGTLIELFFILLFGYLTNMLIETVLCTFVFASIRFFAGGFHQDTYKKCFITTLILFFALPMLSKYIFFYNTLFINSMVWIISLCIIIKNSPCDTINKPITSKVQIIKLKIISALFTVFWAGISTYLILKSNLFLTTCITISAFLEAISTTNFIASKAPIKQKYCANAQ